MKISDEKYDIIVVGGGHAGCEAAIAAAKLGAKTLMLNLYLDSTAMMPCNPSIGGPAKGHIVREIDAIGGVMAEAADFSTRHLRWLNTSKGPAVRSLRAQCDPRKYTQFYINTLYSCPNIEVHQAQVTELVIKNGEAAGVKIKTGQIFYARAIILCTGTSLGSKIHIGLTNHKSGPLGMVAGTTLSRSLRSTGLDIGRFRTDTPPRLKIDTINWDILEKQESLEEPEAFSYFGEKKKYSGMFCGLTRTNTQTHEVIRKHINQSPLVNGELSGRKGPRYCPSIDDKLIKFPEKETHPIFLEPVSPANFEVYMQNFSTSMCLEAQFEAVATIKGCERAHILKPGYAIEYDYLNPLQMYPWLESKKIKRLFTAGQINGTSGYEEAGVQGLIAGINAALILRGEEPLVLGRDKAYFAVLIDDLVTKGTEEPYRMLTSRCEYRLLLRFDNADERLSETGHNIGLLSDEKWNILQKRRSILEQEIERLKHYKIRSSDTVNEMLKKEGAAAIFEGITALNLLRQPNVSWEIISKLSGSRVDKEIGAKIAVRSKYEGYIDRQLRQVEKFAGMEKLHFPSNFNLSAVTGLSAESRQKIETIQPATLGQASRISGVTPADIQLLWVAIEAQRRMKEKK